MPTLIPALFTQAAAGTAATGAAAGLGGAAAQTAALEAAKQATIQASMKQMGVEAAKQAGLEATKQAGIEAAKQAGLEATKQAGLEATKQAGLEASKQGIAQGFQKMLPQAADDAASLAVQSGSDAARNQAIEAFKSAAANPNKGIELGKVAGDVTSLPTAPAGPANPAGPLNPADTYFKPTPNVSAPYGGPSTPPVQGPGLQMKPDVAFGPGSSGVYKGIDPATNLPYETFARPEFTPPADVTGLKVKPEIAEKFGVPKPDPLSQGIAKGVELVKKYPMEIGMGALSLGQYMNEPEEEDKDKYKSTVDMSEFKAPAPSVVSFTPSYKHQGYAVGGPVEQMAALNAVGANTGYPQAGINTPLYSNPMMQRPEAVNVISPSGDAGVSAYSGEPKFAEGGISDEMAREYGLKNRKQRAVKSLTKDYEEMQAERDKEAASLLNERSSSGTIPRSRTQILSSPYSAAIEEHNRLAKKTKTKQYQPPKTSLGDIDTYMDIPVEMAASGGIMGNLGGYSDGGRLLRGPGDGVSDSIPAVIGKRQPARLADGEFVIPARIVSELGNGSTEAGARKLYAMMERIQNTRKKSIGKKKVAVNSRADKHLPA
jgi:hypothetical protein